MAAKLHIIHPSKVENTLKKVENKGYICFFYFTTILHPFTMLMPFCGLLNFCPFRLYS